MTTPSVTPELQVGGTLNPRRHLYLTREDLEDQVYGLLKQGEYCNILSSRQVGKSSIVNKARLRLREDGIRTVYIDLAGELGTPASAEDWYQGFLVRLTRGLRLRIDIKAWWQQNPDGTANLRFLRFFREVVAPALEAPLVIFVDEIDSTLKLNYTDDFFTAIRTMYNKRSMEPAYEQVTFCLVGVASPNELVKDARTTAYNVGRTVEVRDFDEDKDDLAPLVQVIDGKVEDPEAMVHHVLAWTGGHPYLTTRLCQEVIEQKLQTREAVASVVAATFPSIEKVSSDTHFEQIMRFWDTRVDKEAALTLYHRILKKKRIPDQSALQYTQLKLSGIVKRDADGYLVVRNKIYEKLFNRRWIRVQMPVRWWKRIPLWMYVLIGALVVIVALLAVLAGQANTFAQEQGRAADSLRTERDISNSLRLIAEDRANSLVKQIAISDSLGDVARAAAERAEAEAERSDFYLKQSVARELDLNSANLELQFTLDDLEATRESLEVALQGVRDALQGERDALQREVALQRADSLRRFITQRRDEAFVAADSVAVLRNSRNTNPEAISRLRQVYSEKMQQVLAAAQNMRTQYQLAENRPGEAEALASILEAFTATGDLSGMEAYYEEALALYRDLPDYQSTVFKMLERIGDAHLFRGDYSSALASYDSLLEDSKEPGIQMKKGNVQFAMGEYNDAFSSYEEALDTYETRVPDAEHAGALRGTGWRYFRRNQKKKAYQKYNELVDLTETELWYISAEAGAYTRRGMTLSIRGAIAGRLTKNIGIRNDKTRIGLRAEFEEFGQHPLRPGIRFGLQVSHYLPLSKRYCCFRLGAEGLLGPDPDFGKKAFLFPGVELMYERDQNIGGGPFYILYGGIRATMHTKGTTDPSYVPAFGIFFGARSRITF